MANRLPEGWLKPQQFPMNGRWLPNVHPLHVGANNFVDVKNLRPTDTSYETVEGYTKINTSLVPVPVNMHHFSKNSESHMIGKINESGTYSLYDNTAAIPGTGEFSGTSLYTVTSGAGTFANAPKGVMFYGDSSYNLVWGGNELDPLAVFSGDNTTQLKDYTKNLTNLLTSDLMTVGAGGDDSYTVLLLQADDQSDASTTITDTSTGGAGSPHTMTANGDAQIDTAFYKFGVGAILFDGTGDYVSAPDSADWVLGGTSTIDFQIRLAADGVHGICGQYADANNYWQIAISQFTGVTTIVYQAKTSGVAQFSNTSGFSTDIVNNTWNHVEIDIGSNSLKVYLNGTNVVSDSIGTGTIGDIGAVLTIGQSQGGVGPYNLNGSLDEVRISKGIVRHSSAFTPPSIAYFGGDTYFYVCSPFKLNGVKLYVQTANQETSTLSADVWTGAGWSSLAITDGTASGGIALAQTGSVTWTYSEDPAILYINGITSYVYRFTIDTGTADIYKVTVAAPLQPIRDIWNEAPRTVISFQASRSGVNEDYTFPVTSKDSSSEAQYAATIGDLNGISGDSIEIFLDDRAMGLNFTMVSNLVNSADCQIDDIKYWDGDSYTSVGYFNDSTLDSAGDSSFAQSGVLSWNPPSSDSEQPQEKFGVKGYGYKITIDGTLTGGTAHNGTSIDLVTGITAPLPMTGYNAVGLYNRRVMLIKNNQVDFSQTDTPWVFNGVDSSDNGRLSIEFGDDNAIVGTTNLFNRYGSSLIETWVVFKKNSMFILTGSQPYIEYQEPFIVKSVSHNIGLAAPLTLNSYQMEVSEGIRMSVILWMDFSGPYIYNGAQPQKLEGIENFFNPASSTKINTSYISASWAYIDSVNDQWNLCFPTGASTVPNKWVVYDFKRKKWFEKVPSSYPTMASHVVDTNGVRYNYGFLATGQMLRLDNGQTWDGSTIAQSLKTGLFSPPEIDNFGLWTISKIHSIRLLSSKITEDQNATVTIYNDGTLSSNSLTIDLSPSSGIISKNDTGRGNLSEQASFFQVNFAASTSTDKWTPLAWGYKARLIRED